MGYHNTGFVEKKLSTFSNLCLCHEIWNERVHTHLQTHTHTRAPISAGSLTAVCESRQWRRPGSWRRSAGPVVNESDRRSPEPGADPLLTNSRQRPYMATPPARTHAPKALAIVTHSVPRIGLFFLFKLWFRSNFFLSTVSVWLFGFFSLKF